MLVLLKGALASGEIVLVGLAADATRNEHREGSKEDEHAHEPRLTAGVGQINGASRAHAAPRLQYGEIGHPTRKLSAESLGAVDDARRDEDDELTARIARAPPLKEDS